MSRRVQEEATWERAAAARVELAVREVEARAAAQAARSKAEHDTRIRTTPCGKQSPRGFGQLELQRPARPARARSISARPPSRLGQLGEVFWLAGHTCLACLTGALLTTAE